MSFGGSVTAMIITLRNNARPKQKAFAYSRKKKISLKKHYALKFKRVSPTNLEKIRSKIKVQSEKEDRRKLIKLLSFLLIISIGLIYFTLHYARVVKATNAEVVRKRNENIANQKAKNEALKNMDVKFFIASAEKALKKKNFKEAKHQYNLALKINPDNYPGCLGLVKAYVLDCIYNDNNCYNSEYLLDKTINKFGNTEELNALQSKLKKHKI